VSFVPNSKTREFLERLEKGKIVGSRCKSCGEFSFPPRADCDNCLSEEVEWVDLDPEGVIVTYTTIHIPPAGFEGNEPYTICVVDLKQGGRLLAWLKEGTEQDLEVGKPVKVVLEDLGDNRMTYAVKL